MTNEITTTTNIDPSTMESVLLSGDLSKLTPAQRVSYYRNVCESVGLNPLTKPFDYINLNGKLTLYAKKDATDQLRKIHEVSIDDVDIVETDKQFVVKVKGHDKTGRTDVEVGVVNKSDMRGDTANAQMKAVTKSKRRLTLSLCGLGWLDETEVQTIPDARPVRINNDTGEIIEAGVENVNQETGEVTDAVELIDPMGSWAVKYACDAWSCKPSEAAPRITALKLGKKIDKADFIQIVEDNK
jgi:hypothetical protein